MSFTKITAFLCLLIGSIAFGAVLGWQAFIVGVFFCIGGTIIFTRTF